MIKEAVYYDSTRIFHGSLMNIMGTGLGLLLINKSRIESYEVWGDIVSELRRLDLLFNRFDKNSETSKINCEAKLGYVQTSAEMIEVLKSCKDYHKRTLGIFDITLNDISQVILNEKNNSVAFSNENISLDFGGYAKGYALLKIKDILHNAEVEHCFVDFGNSSIFGMGNHPYGSAWKVGVKNPFMQDSILDEIELSDNFLSISGNSPSYCGHIKRPGTEESVMSRKVISIVAENPVDAEVLSTTFMIANSKEQEIITGNFKIENIGQYNI